MLFVFVKSTSGQDGVTTSEIWEQISGHGYRIAGRFLEDAGASQPRNRFRLMAPPALFVSQLDMNTMPASPSVKLNNPARHHRRHRRLVDLLHHH
jgi:hypothetical protein